MHPLHDYIARQLGERVNRRGIVVWYDPRGEFRPFIAEARRELAGGVALLGLPGGDVQPQLFEYEGSFLAIRAAVEPFVSQDNPQPVIVYVPDVERDRRTSLLLELELAGDCYEPALKSLARNVLRQKYTDGIVDELLNAPAIDYEDIARAAENGNDEGEPPSVLKVIFHGVSGGDNILADWLAKAEHDDEIDEKGARRELAKLVQSRLGLELPDDAPVAKLRAITMRYVLAGEFRLDLKGDPLVQMEGIPFPTKKDKQEAVRGMASRLRLVYPDEYKAGADRVESEFGLERAGIAPECLGATDTFRFEERVILAHCGSLVAAGRFAEARVLIAERERSFWLDQDVARKFQWQAYRQMAELGMAAADVQTEVTKGPTSVEALVDDYIRQGGWHRLDRAQRELEAIVSSLEEETDERALAVVRRAYEDACHLLAERFANALVKADWSTGGLPHQTQVFARFVKDRPKPVAYFLVDAMRYEMGLDLTEKLFPKAETTIQALFGALPGVTPVGMGAMQPGASASFDVGEQKGKLGAVVEGVFLPDVGARQKYAASRLPALIDMTLDDLLDIPQSRLVKRIEGAQVIIIRSQEIDLAGEAVSAFHARRMMGAVVENIARAVRKLAAVGVEQSVVAADHGHLYFGSDRDESMRTDSPGGETVELHRRCWAGRGGKTPAGCVRVSAQALGYASDLEFVFPPGVGVFRAGGDLAYHHGGLSPQEVILPVVTVRMPSPVKAHQPAVAITVEGLPDVITNRIFSVKIELDSRGLALFSEALQVKPVLVSGGKQAGGVRMAVDAELDPASGSFTIHSRKPVSAAFLLTDEEAKSVRLLIVDPATDAELYRSPKEIPVSLGV
jgi:hypothetical protein